MTDVSPIPWWNTSFQNGEAEAAANAILNRNISQGPVVEGFEKKLATFLGVDDVIATTSGSMALVLALLASGVQAGDEVIVPNRTWIATGHSATLIGAKVKLAEVHPERSTILTSEVRRLITKRTRAIIAVHPNGRSAPIEELRSVAKDHNISLIEDAAQALGSKTENGMLGAQGDIGCFSLSVAKIISTGQGGFLTVRDPEKASLVRQLRTHGVSNVFSAEWAIPGGNFRFTDILAAVGCVQLNHLGSRIERARLVLERYTRNLETVPVKVIGPAGAEVGPYVEVLTPRREELIRFLELAKIESRRFYPNLSTAPYWATSRIFSNSEVFESQGIWLPSGPGITDHEVDRVCERISEFFRT